MTKALIVIGGIIITGVLVLAHEVGKYCEEVNPYSGNRHDIGSDFDGEGAEVRDE